MFTTVWTVRKKPPNEKNAGHSLHNAAISLVIIPDIATAISTARWENEQSFLFQSIFGVEAKKLLWMQSGHEYKCKQRRGKII